MKRRRPSILALPAGVKLEDFYFEPTAGEKRADTYRKTRLRKLEWLDEQQKLRDASELQWLRDRVAVLESVIQADKEFVAAENERDRRRMAAEAETKRVHDWWVAEQHRELLARAERAGREINRDICKTERKVLEQRGIVRGKRR
jgi:hypothetical protein